MLLKNTKLTMFNPNILKIDYTDENSIADALKQFVELPTPSYSYTGKIYENYISFTEDELQNATSSIEQFISIGAKKAQRFAEVIQATKANIAKQLITMSLVETLLKFKKADYFDPSKDYQLTKKIDLQENNQVSEKLSYQTFRDTEEVTDETQFGVCFQPIKANEFESFDAAVEAGKIIVYQIIFEVEKPGTGENVEEEKINSGKFLRKIAMLRNESNHNTQGFSLSGNLIDGDNKTIDMYYTDETIPALMPFLANTYHPEKLMGLDGKIVQFHSFGHSNALMSKIEDKDLYDNSSPINKAITNGYSDENIFETNYNLYGYGVDSDKLAIFTVRDLYDFDHAGQSGIDTIYHRFQPLCFVSPNCFEVILVKSKKVLFQDLGLIVENNK